MYTFHNFFKKKRVKYRLEVDKKMRQKKFLLLTLEEYFTKFPQYEKEFYNINLNKKIKNITTPNESIEEICEYTLDNEFKSMINLILDS